MAKSMKVIPIRPGRSMTEQQQEIVELAFEVWLERFGVLDGSPEDDFYRAQREVLARRSMPPGAAARLILVDKSGQ